MKANKTYSTRFRNHLRTNSTIDYYSSFVYKQRLRYLTILCAGHFVSQFNSAQQLYWGRRKIFFILACEVIALLRHHLHDTWLVRFSLHIEYLEFTEGHWSHTYVSIGHINQNGLSYLSLIKTHWQHALSLVEYEQVLRQQGWILQSFLKNRAEY